MTGEITREYMNAITKANSSGDTITSKTLCFDRVVMGSITGMTLRINPMSFQ